jgi:hypothetical protein
MRRALLLAAILSLAVAAPVAASAINDTPATAIDIPVGSTVTEDTTVADETDPAETALNEVCGAPAVEHGVWFEITPTNDAFVSFDTSESDYPVGLMLFVGDATTGSFISCGPEQLVESLAGGTTYLLMAFGFDTESATAGTLRLHVTEVAPPPDIEVTIDKVAFVDRQGVVRLTGTATCTSEDGSGTLIEVFGDVTQKVGRFLIRGFFGTGLDAPCDGSTIQWEAFAVGDNGVFAGGKALTIAFAFGCADLCSEAFAEATIQLRRSGK